MGFLNNIVGRLGGFLPNTKEGKNNSTSTDNYNVGGLTPLEMEQNQRSGTHINWQAGKDGAFVSPRVQKVEDAIPTGENKG